MARYHIEGFRKAGGEVVALADLNVEVANEVASANDIPDVYDDVGKMLETDVDAVSIIVPNKFHASLAMQALEAGKHVFCEKPPALNSAQVEEMIATRDRVGKELKFNFNNRARPESIEMMKFIREGRVGHINSAQAKWVRRTGIPGFGGWFTTKEISGGGPVIDLLHMLDLAMYFMGYPKPAHVIGQTFDDHITDRNFKGPWGIPDREGGVTDVEAAAHGFVKFETGQVLSVQMSWAEMVKREEVSVVFQGVDAGGKVERLFGEDGIDETAVDTCELYEQVEGKSVDHKIEVEECEDMGRINSAANFVEALEGRAEPLSRTEEGLKLMQVIDAIYQSAETGKPVAI